MCALIFCLLIGSVTISKVFCNVGTSGIGEFPFFGELAIPFTTVVRGRAPRISYSLCGATLVHPRWMLTAARCFPNDTLALHAIQRSTENEVFMGRNTVRNSIIQIHRHPNFQWTKFGNFEKVAYDVALVKVRGPFRINNLLQTIRLPPADEEKVEKSLRECKTGMAIGTGKTTTNYHAPNRKFPYIKLKVKKREDLQEALPPSMNLFYSEMLTDHFNALRDNKGGPFVCNDTGAPIQYGVMSQQVQGRRTVIVGYESIYKYMDFILKIVPDINRRWMRRIRPAFRQVVVRKSALGG